jgi:hypothetical protein
MPYRIAMLMAVLYTITAWVWTQSAFATPWSSNSQVQRIISQASGWVPLDKVNIEVRVDNCPGLSNVSCNYDGVIYIEPDMIDADVIDHEIGHAWDATLLKPWDRSVITRRYFDIADSVWQPYNGQDAVNNCIGTNKCPNEMFADGFSACALDFPHKWGYYKNETVTRGYWMPWTPKLKRRFCAMVVRIGGAAD